MNALISHLRFLRPVRSLFMVGTYVIISWLSPRQERDTAHLMTLVIALPLLLALFISGAVHEPMHRPLAPLLPGLRQRQRRIAAATIFLCALAITYGVHLSTPTVSPLAAFGLAAALLALPCLSRHRQSNDFLFLLVAFSVVLVLQKRSAGLDPAVAMNTAPWLFLVGGLAITSACLALGFSRASLRARASIPFVATQTQFFSHLFLPKVSALWHEELAVAKRSRPQGQPSPAGRDWTVRTVGSSSCDWLRVLWHAQFGAREGSPPASLQLSTVGWGIAGLFCLPAIEVLLRNVPSLTGLSNLAGSGPSRNFQFIFATMMALSVLPPRLAYPISRARLGRIVFRQAVIVMAMALSLPVVMLLLPSLVGQAASESYLPGYGLPTLFTRALFLAVLLPLIVVITIQVPWGSRLCRFIGVFIALLTGSLIENIFGNYIPTAGHVLGFFLAAAVSLALLRLRLHRHYATCDLLSGAATIHSR